jgi:predicted nucleic acid-binding protein
MPKVARRFIDTNVLLYLLSAEEAKADRAEETLAGGGVVSVQVLNEFASVATRKLGMSIAETRETLAIIRAVCGVVSVDEETHDLGLRIAERYGMSVYDSMVIASALQARCDELLSEDFQQGQRIEGRVVIRNPFSMV